MARGSSSISGSSRGSAGPSTITILTATRTTVTAIRMAPGMDMASGMDMIPGMYMIPARTTAHITAVETATIPLTTIRAATIRPITTRAATIRPGMAGTATGLTIGPPSPHRLPTSRTNWRQQVNTMDESTASWGRRHVMRWSVIRAPRGWSRAGI